MWLSSDAKEQHIASMLNSIVPTPDVVSVVTEYTTPSPASTPATLSRRGAKVCAILPPRVIVDMDRWLLGIEQQACSSAECTGTWRVLNGTQKGEVIIIHVKCTRCTQRHKITNVAQWEGNKRTGGKRGPAIKRFNLEVVAIELLDGGTHEVYRRRRHELGLGALSQSAHRAAEKEVVAKIELVNAQLQAECLAKYRSGEWKLEHMAGDGSWATRRNASVHNYNMVDVIRGKIICEVTLVKRVVRQMHGKEVIITKGNYDGTSKGMENEACRQVFAILEKEGVLSKVMSCTTDDDSSVKKFITEDHRLAHIEVPSLFSCTTKE